MAARLVRAIRGSPSSMVRTRASLQVKAEAVISSPPATKPEPSGTRHASGSEENRRKKTPSKASKEELVQAAEAPSQQTTDAGIKPTRNHARKQSRDDVKIEVKTVVKTEAEVVSI